MQKTLEKIKKLSRDERNYIILDLLTNNDLKFEELLSLYVEYLERKDRENRTIINGLSIPLIQYWQGGDMMRNMEHLKFIRSKAAYNLLKGKAFRTAPIENDLEDLVKKSGYSEDKNGLHTIK